MEIETFKFEELRVYQKSLEVIEETNLITYKFPKHELFGLNSQFNRAALSIALNISEGASDTHRQFHKFIQIAIGSLNECVVCITVARIRDYIDLDIEADFRKKLVELSKMLFSLRKHLQSKLDN